MPITPTNTAKHSATGTNTAKNIATFTDTVKHTISPTNTTKHSSTPTSTIKTIHPWTYGEVGFTYGQVSDPVTGQRIYYDSVGIEANTNTTKH